MATAPDVVRRALLRISGAAGREVRAVSAAAVAEEPTGWRAAMFAAVPLILGEYGPAASTLALDWFDDIRLDAQLGSAFTPTPRLVVTDDEMTAMVARATEPTLAPDFDAELERLTTQMAAQIQAEIEGAVADVFRGNIIENASDDPDSVGWRRFARPGACKFCLMLAARGAVYTEATARFAAHGAEMRGGRKGGECMCIAGPAYGGKEIWAEATPIQYTASKRRRTAEERAALRDYLNSNYPDAPG